MKNFIFYIVSATMFLSIACSETVENPSAEFTIEVDSIVDGVLVRMEVNTVKTGQMVYFVKQNDSWFNSIWPGDSTSSGDYHDYGTCDEGKVFRLMVSEEGDTNYLMRSEPCQGLALANGTDELSYVYEYPGDYIVTWIASNSGLEEIKTVKSNKVIKVE